MPSVDLSVPTLRLGLWWRYAPMPRVGSASLRASAWRRSSADGPGIGAFSSRDVPCTVEEAGLSSSAECVRRFSATSLQAQAPTITLRLHCPQNRIVASLEQSVVLPTWQT